MKQFLFTVGLGVSDRPERWQGICEIYAKLAKGLTRLGHHCCFIVNPYAVNAKALVGFDTLIGDHTDLQKTLEQQLWNGCFVWGGRIKPDIRSADIISRFDVPIIYSELGWFPQRGTIYFDHCGTNSAMSYKKPPALKGARKLQFSLIRERACRKIYGQSYFKMLKRNADFKRKVFVPLQDETDTNITIDSPFETMDKMLQFLSENYPNHNFTTRIHPKATPPKINKYPNVEIQNPNLDPYNSLHEFGVVAGINSTMITEAAFMGCETICFGNGIAKTYGLARYIKLESPPQNLFGELEDCRSRRDDALAYLYLIKQLRQDFLTSPSYLKKSYLGKIIDL